MEDMPHFLWCGEPHWIVDRDGNKVSTQDAQKMFETYVTHTPERSVERVYQEVRALKEYPRPSRIPSKPF